MWNSCELDLATGEVIHEVTDVDLSTSVPVVLTRRYTSSYRESGILGWGWIHNFTPSVSLDASGVTKHDPINGDTFFALETCDGVKGPRSHFTNDDARLVLEYATGSKEIYAQDPTIAKRWMLLKVSDGNGNTSRYRYKGQLLRSIETSGRMFVCFAYSHADLLSRITVLAGSTTNEPLLQVRYEYDAHRNLVASGENNRQAWLYEYVDHLLVRSIDYNKYGKNYVYDKDRRCVGTWLDGGYLVRNLQYDDVRKNTLIADSNGFQSLLRCNENRIIVAHVDPKGQITERILDQNGGVLSIIAADGNTTDTYMLDPETGIVSDSDVNGGLWERQLDNHGRLIRISSPSGRVETYEYDIQGRLVKQVKWNGGIIQFQYDERGEVSSLIDSLGYEIRREVSSNGRIVRFIDRYGVLYEQQFDELANLLVDFDARGGQTQFTYKMNDFPEQITGPGGATDHFEYDQAMNMVAHTDALGRVHRTEYDALGNIIAEIDPMGGRVEYIYDNEENLRCVVNQKGEKIEISYDELYREVKTKYFDGKVLYYEFDPCGRRTAIIDSEGGRTELVYQGEIDIQTRVFPDGTREEYELNEDGEFVRIAFVPQPHSNEEPREAEFTYNESGRLASETHNNRTIEYDWDLCNQLVAIRDSLGDETIYMRGDRYRIDKIIDMGREYQLRYLPTGEVSEIIFPNGMRQLCDFDEAGRMVERRMLSEDRQVLTWRRFTYDACDQLIEMEDWHWGKFHYRYDLLGQIVAVIADGNSFFEAYQYDATSNLIHCPLASNIVIDEGNRIRIADNQQFEYDANGNLVKRRDNSHEWRYEWDRDEQLARVVCDNVTVATYEYDLLNRRVRKTTTEGKIDFLYETYNLRAEIFEDGSRNHYVSLPGLPVPIAQWHNGEYFYYGYNQIGTPIEVFNEAGELLLSVCSEAYGAARREYRPTGSDIELLLNFMGQYFDAESGLFYNHFRYYDASLGRYISQDPLKLYAGMNFYIYPTNPNGCVDPRGLMPTFTCPNSWGPCQQWYAREKIKAINNASKKRRRKTCTECRSGAQKRDFIGKQCGYGVAGKGRQIDHLYELQAGGSDRCCANYRSVEKKFNNKLGSILKNETLKDLDVGQTIGKIKMINCRTKGPCDKAGQNRVAKPPPEAKKCKEDKPVTDEC